MKKFFNWLFGIGVKPDTKEDEEKRIAEINSAYDELQRINSEIERNERELRELNRFLNSH